MAPAPATIQALNNRDIKYLGTGSTVIDPAMKESLALKKSYWDDNGISGTPSIVINLGKQTASFYKDGKLVGVSAISSGREGFDTPAGNYKIMQRDLNHASNLYGDYVDASGNVVVKNVDVKKDPRPPGLSFPGRSDAVFYAHYTERGRDASRVSARCAGQPWLHPHARKNGEALLGQRPSWNTGDRRAIDWTLALKMARFAPGRAQKSPRFRADSPEFRLESVTAFGTPHRIPRLVSFRDR